MRLFKCVCTIWPFVSWRFSSYLILSWEQNENNIRKSGITELATLILTGYLVTSQLWRCRSVHRTNGKCNSRKWMRCVVWNRCNPRWTSRQQRVLSVPVQTAIPPSAENRCVLPVSGTHVSHRSRPKQERDMWNRCFACVIEKLVHLNGILNLTG